MTVDWQGSQSKPLVMSLFLLLRLSADFFLGAGVLDGVGEGVEVSGVGRTRG